MKIKSERKRQEFIDACLELNRMGEFDGLVVDDLSKVGIWRGLVMEVNDHGNITIYQSFKNGTLREIASRV